MPTIKSMMNKICSDKTSKKARKTLNLQSDRENKLHQRRILDKETPNNEYNWRLAIIKSR